MTLASEQATFIQDLADLWDNADENTTVFDTGDLFEDYFSGAAVAGGVSGATTIIPKSTYPGLSPMATPFGLAPVAAAAFEAALLALVLGTVFIPVPPVTLIGPVHIPIGPAVPGVLTLALTPILLVPSAESKVALLGGIFATYLQSWTTPVTTPGPVVVPTPII